LLSTALPRVRDFKGVSTKSFDGRGNYTLGIKEQIIFPEINYDRIEKIKGMNITIVTTARSDEEGRALLRYFGMPFRTAMTMAKLSKMAQAKRLQKKPSSRCAPTRAASSAGAAGVLNKFQMCRICFRIAPSGRDHRSDQVVLVVQRKLAGAPTGTAAE